MDRRTRDLAFGAVELRHRGKSALFSGQELSSLPLPVGDQESPRLRARGVPEDVSITSGLGPTSLGFTGFGTAWFDFNNDGWLDLLVANGAIEAIKERGVGPFPAANASFWPEICATDDSRT
jgi:hypothetical protein